jgi:hypothetical protein
MFQLKIKCYLLTLNTKSYINYKRKNKHILKRLLFNQQNKTKLLIINDLIQIFTSN